MTPAKPSPPRLDPTVTPTTTTPVAATSSATIPAPHPPPPPPPLSGPTTPIVDPALSLPLPEIAASSHSISRVADGKDTSQITNTDPRITSNAQIGDPSTTDRQNTPPTSIGSIGDLPVFVQPTNGGAVVGGTTTLRPGQTTTIGTTTIRVDPSSSAVIVGQDTLLPGQSTTISGTVIAAQPTSSLVVVGSTDGRGLTTLRSGQTTTISGTPIVVDPSSVVIGTSTVPMPGAGPSAFVLNIGPAASPVTVGLSNISGSQILGLGSMSIELSGTAAGAATLPGLHTISGVVVQGPSVAIAGSTITAGSSGQLVISGQTLVPGGTALTVSGTTYSLALSASYIVVNGKTTSLARVMSTVATYSIQGSTGKSLSATSTGRQSYTGAGSVLSAVTLLYTTIVPLVMTLTALL